MPSGAGLTFTAISLLLAWLLWQGRGGADPLWRLRLRSLLPPLLLAALLPSGCANERFDSLRLFASGMTVTETRLQPGAQGLPVPGCEAYFRAGEQPVFVVGPARGCVDLVVREPNDAEVNGAVVRLDHRAGAEPQLRLATLTGGGGVLVAARDGGGGRSFTGAVSIEDGDQICIRACGSPGAAWWTFRSSGRLERGDDVRTMSLRPGPYGWVEPYGPTDRIHRLSRLLCDRPGEGGACDEPALADPAAQGRSAQPALSFLFQEGGIGGSGWRAMLLDPGAQLRRAGGAAVPVNLAEQVALRDGESTHVAILSLRGNALREVRSFTIGHEVAGEGAAERRFRLTLDTPEMVPIGQCAQPLSRLAPGQDQVSPEAFALSSFGNRPDSVLASASAALPIDRFDLCRSTRFAFSSPLEPPEDDGVGSRIFRQVDFSIDRMGIPWMLVLIAFSVALMVHAASERLWQRRPLDGIVLTLLQYLLVVRAAVGIEGVFNDADLNWRLIYGDIGTAMVVLPAILIAVRRRDETSLTALLAIAIFVATALGALWWWLGRPDMISQFLAGLAFAALGLRAFTLRSVPASRSEAPEPAASAPEIGPSNGPVALDFTGAKSSATADTTELPPQPLPTKGKGLFRRARGLFTGLFDRPPSFWLVLLLAIAIPRILLGLLGYRERFFGITLSAIYVPLLLVVIAAILATAEREPPRRRLLGIYFLGALALGVGLVAIVINDVGFGLVHVPPIAGIALWRLRQWQREEAPAGSGQGLTRAMWAAPAAGLVAGYFAIWAFVAFTPPPPADQLEERVAYAVAERSTDPNWLRLRAVFAPDQIAEIGNRAAAIQLDQSAMLGDLTGTLLGHGWLTPVDLGSFLNQATHLSDYLSASHLMAPFGRLGAIALLLVIAAAAGAAVFGRVQRPAAWPNLAGALAIWTLFGAAAYMVLANLLLVPFTGRNIYLLAASSGGDLMEGLGLLLMARIGLAYGRTG
jgi:hypothetical protein